MDGVIRAFDLRANDLWTTLAGHTDAVTGIKVNKKIKKIKIIREK